MAQFDMVRACRVANAIAKVAVADPYLDTGSPRPRIAQLRVTITAAAEKSQQIVQQPRLQI